METGHKTILKNNRLNKIESKELSIQVGLSGLSFSILNTSSKTIEHLYAIYFEKKLTPADVLEALIKELSTNSVFSTSNFSNIYVIHQNELATFVPNGLYDEASNADYLKFNNKILSCSSDTHRRATSAQLPTL